MRSFLLRTLVIAGLVSIGACSANAQQGSVRALDKATAAKILTSMGYTNVVVGAVIKSVGGMGMGAFSSESAVMVLAIGNRGGGTKRIQESMFYDSELGWFYFEPDQQTRLRVWSASGYKEFTPAPDPK